MIIPLEISELQSRVDIWEREGRCTIKASKIVGVDRSNFYRSIRRAAKMGLCDFGKPLAGFETSRVTQRFDKHGVLIGHGVEQKPESGPKFKMPAGQTLDRGTYYLDAQNQIKGQWVKVRKGFVDPDILVNEMKAAFENWTPKMPALAKPKDATAEMMTLYVLNDWHLGLNAWGEETGGNSWNLEIAQQKIGGALNGLFEQTPKSGRGVILGLGDLIHADNTSNTTERSGHPLDVDGRQPQSVDVGIEMLSNVVEMAASKHSKVDVILKAGNHDPQATAAMRYGLRGFFNRSERINVCGSRDPFWFDLFGVNYLAAAHAHAARKEAMASIMANYHPEMWGVSTHRAAHTAHIHHDTLKETGGVSIWSHQAPVKKDFWHYSMGYVAGRSMKAFNYHLHEGYKGNIVEMLH